MSKQRTVVHLRVYRPFNGENRIFLDEHRNVQNENHIVKLIHGTFDFLDYFKTVNILFFKVELEKVTVEKDGKFVDVNDISKYKQEVNELLNPVPVVELTPEQKRIADLEAKIEALTSANKTPVKQTEEVKPKTATKKTTKS